MNLKHIKKLALGLSLGSAILVTSCKDPIAEMVKFANEQNLNVDPNPLELHGDQVPFKMSAKLPVKMMKKGRKYTLEVSYVPGNIDAYENETTPEDAVKVGAVPFDGDKYQGQAEDPQVSKEFSFGYEDKYETGGLIIKGIATKKKNNKSKEFGPIKLMVEGTKPVKGVATTVRLLKSPVDGVNPTTSESPFAYGDHNYVGPKEEYLEVPVFFEQGSSNVSPTTASNKETIEMVSELFKEAKVGPFKAAGTSSHSPEGREAINRDLADKRASALEDRFKYMLKTFNYSKDTIEGVEFEFEKKVLGETVPEFNSLVDESSLSEEEKSEAKEIMGRDGDFTENELALHDKPYYRTLMTEVYPKMRYAKTSVKKPAVEKTLPEMSAIVKGIMDDDTTAEALTEQEYLYVAANTPDLDERVKILQTSLKQYDTWKVNNNVGAAYLDMALLKSDMTKVDEAITALEASMGKKETGEAAYNLAMAYAMKDDSEKMEEYLEKAANLGSQDPKVEKLINGAKGYLAIKGAKARDDGKYKEGEDILGQAIETNPNIFNKGLAQLMQGVNYDSAIASFNSAAQKNPKDAVTQYALAVAYARKGDESNMSSALKKACELDSDLKAKALKDVEFDKYKNNNSFKDAVK